jgi:sirohydrochlorin cobaltochelatase
MKTIIVLAMHGSIPDDIPNNELSEYFGLHSRLETMPGAPPEEMKKRYLELDEKIRSWPRTGENDPFFAASNRLASALHQKVGLEVLVGFNEFCDPDIEETLTKAATNGAERIIVVTPMMTPGGEHSEKDIPRAISKFKENNTNIKVDYSWPFDLSDVAEFLGEQIKKTVGLSE